MTDATIDALERERRRSQRSDKLACLNASTQKRATAEAIIMANPEAMHDLVALGATAKQIGEILAEETGCDQSAATLTRQINRMRRKSAVRSSSSESAGLSKPGAAEEASSAEMPVFGSLLDDDHLRGDAR